MKKLILLSILLLSLVAGGLNAQNRVTTYQGNLIDAISNLPMTGTVQMTFELYTTQLGGSQLWSEIQNVTLEKGYFNVYLGSVNPFPANLDLSKQLWLQITVGNGSAYPRTPLTPSFSSMYADKAALAGLADDIKDGIVTLEKLADEAKNMGGDLTGTLPNPKIRKGAFLEAIEPGSITQEMLSPNVSTRPSGPASGDLTGWYPDPLIAPMAVKTDRIDDLAVTNEKIANNAVTAEKIAPLSIYNAHITDNAIETRNIMNAAVTTDKINDLAVTTAKINDLAVTTGKIANAAVTQEKLDPNVSAYPWGPAGGDLMGTYPNPGVDALYGVSLATPALLHGDVYMYNAVTNAWESTQAAGDIFGEYNNITVSKLLNIPLAAQPTTAGEVYMFDGANWIPAGSGGDVSGLYNNLQLNPDVVTTIELAPNAVITENILDLNVTNAKLAANSVTTDKIADGQVMTADIANLNVTTEKINDLAVTTGKINDLAVTNAKLAMNSVTSDKIVDGQVMTDDIANLNVTTEKLADLAVTNAKLAANAVQTVNILDLNVTTEKIANSAITGEKILDNTIESFDIALNTIEPYNVNLGAMGWNFTELAQGGNPVLTTASFFDGDISGLYNNLQLKADVVTTIELAVDAVYTENILNAAVTNAKLAANSVTTDKIADGQVMTDDIANLNVTTEKINNLAVTTAKLADDAVTTAKILDMNVTNAKLAANAVTTDKIMDGTIVNADVNDNAAIAGTKINPDFGNQNIITTGDVTATNGYFTNTSVTNGTFGTLTVNGVSYLRGDISNDLGALPVTINDALDVYGNLYTTSDLTVDGNVFANAPGTIAFFDNADVANNLDVWGSLVASDGGIVNDFFVGNDLMVGNDLTVNNSAVVGSLVVVNGATIATGNLNLVVGKATSAATVAGDAANTLTTKGYVDAADAAINVLNEPFLTFGASAKLTNEKVLVGGNGMNFDATTGTMNIDNDATLAVTATQIGLNLGNANTWTATQTFNNGLVASNTAQFNGSIKFTPATLNGAATRANLATEITNGKTVVIYSTTTPAERNISTGNGLPALAVADAGRVIYLVNGDAAATLVVLGKNVQTSEAIALLWTGSAWVKFADGF